MWLDDRSWFARHKILTVLGGLVVVGIIGQAIGGNEATPVANPAIASSPTAIAPSASTTKAEAPPTSSAPSTKANAPTPAQPVNPDPTDTSEPSDEYGSQPKKETGFIAAVSKAQEAADGADNDLKLGAALSRRNTTICKVVDGGKVKDWTGKVASLDANGEGKAVISIEVADNVHLSTWNNAFSDYEDDTLIPPGSLFDKFLSFHEGQVITFSGKLIRGDTCVNDSRLTLTGKLTDPDFIFKFSSAK